MAWHADAEFPWMTVFMEAAVRAIRVVHHAHQPLTLGRAGQDNQGTWLERLNIGHGIELADERLVCSQILIELATSRTTSHVHFPAQPALNSLAGHRTFEFDREKYEKHIGYVDLVFKRTNDDDGRYGHVYIEAKRARRWRSYAEDGRAEPYGQVLLSEIDDDIKKLRDISRGLRKDEEAYFYVLVWGSSDDADAPTPAMLSGKGCAAGHSAWRWLPLSWEEGSWSEHPRKVDRWLWLALLEVEQHPRSTRPSVG